MGGARRSEAGGRAAVGVGSGGWRIWVCGWKGAAPMGGSPNLEKVGPRRVGGPKISRFFFPLPPQFSFFLSLWVSSRVFFPLSRGLLVEFWWCFGRSGLQMCLFSPSGCRVEALPAACRREREKKKSEILGGPAEGRSGAGCPGQWVRRRGVQGMGSGEGGPAEGGPAAGCPGQGVGGKVVQGRGVQGMCYRFQKRGLKNKIGLNNIWSRLKKASGKGLKNVASDKTQKDIWSGLKKLLGFMSPRNRTRQNKILKFLNRILKF